MEAKVQLAEFDGDREQAREELERDHPIASLRRRSSSGWSDPR